MAELCENCLKPIKDHWNESPDGVNYFCSTKCREKWEKKQEKKYLEKYKFTDTKITCNEKKDFIILRITQKNTEQPSFLFCDKIEFYANHLMIYRKGNLIFKVWLDDKKRLKLKTVKQAIESVGMEI